MNAIDCPASRGETLRCGFNQGIHLGSIKSGSGIQFKIGFHHPVVQMADGTGWRWEVQCGGKTKSGVTPLSRAAAIKVAEYEIDRVVKDK